MSTWSAAALFTLIANVLVMFETEQQMLSIGNILSSLRSPVLSSRLWRTGNHYYFLGWLCCKEIN